MDSIRLKARQAKQRLKSNFWEECEKQLIEEQAAAKSQGKNQNKVSQYVKVKVKNSLNGEKEDEFYTKVKNLLNAEGEVSDALGRLTDREIYDKLSYEEKQRYTLELSAKYVRALEKYKKEKELTARG